MKCNTPKCKNKARKRGKDCNTCHARKAVAKNPMRKCYRNKKADAKRDGIPFSLSFEQFKELCIETDYIRGRGKKSLSYTLDRIETRWPDGSVRGYDVDNIQVLPLGQNSRKQHLLDKYFDEKGIHWYVKNNTPGLNHVACPIPSPF